MYVFNHEIFGVLNIKTVNEIIQETVNKPLQVFTHQVSETLRITSGGMDDYIYQESNQFQGQRFNNESNRNLNEFDQNKLDMNQKHRNIMANNSYRMPGMNMQPIQPMPPNMQASRFNSMQSLAVQQQQQQMVNTLEQNARNMNNIPPNTFTPVITVNEQQINNASTQLAMNQQDNVSTGNTSNINDRYLYGIVFFTLINQ